MPDVVVIGFDGRTLTYEKLERACTYIRNGAVLATHLDINQSDEGWIYPGLRRHARRFHVDGKGAEVRRKTVHETVDMVLELTGANREEVFVGDRIYTDVKTGVVNGAHGSWF